MIAWFGQAFWGTLYTAGALVTLAWTWVAVITFRTKRRPAPSTLRAMLMATVALGVALIWPALEPHILRALRG